MITQNVDKTNAKRISIISFSLFFAWILSFPFEGQVLYSVSELYSIDITELVFSSIAAHFMGLFIAGFLVSNMKAAKRTMLLTTVICIIGSAAFIFPYLKIWLVILVVVSFAAGLFVASWGYYLKSCTPKNGRIKTTADVLIYSNILMIIINLAAIHLSPNTGLVLCIMTLAFTLYFVNKLPADTEEYSKNTVYSSRLANPVKPFIILCLFIVIITINSGLMYQVFNPAFSHLEWLTSWYWAVPYIIALYVVRNLKPHSNRAYILYVAIAMIGFAFISFMILDRSAPSYLVVNTLMLGACGVCDLFWWSIIGELLEFSKNPVRILGIGLSANVLGVLIGGMIGNAITMADNLVYKPTLIAMAIVLMILIILPLINNQLTMALTKHAFLSNIINVAKEEKEESISDFMRKNGLTERECEIAAMLLDGKTYKMIAADLCLSQNTVKTHIKNVYSKLNIQRKSELFKLVADK